MKKRYEVPMGRMIREKLRISGTPVRAGEYVSIDTWGT